ncbi:MAG TPA: DUF1513 domain-containing protein, partial [Alphaproteobacteria bacterium]|nr:DUF1513 domain-containing protein [Alphaproteobacteria bacterium]
RYALILDIARRRIRKWLHPKPGRSFAGHGVYSRDGRLLYAVEFERETAEGVIAVYDATAGYRRIGEFKSGGIGPHQVTLSADGRSLVLCIGGIRTHPDYPRAKLNIPSMRSSAVLIDAASGRISERLELSGLDHRLSLRHLDVAADGRVVIGMQYQGPQVGRVRLVALHRPGSGIAALETPPEAQAALRHYVGSIAFDRGGNWIAATSPRGGSVALWRASDGAYAGRVKMADVCGLAAGSPAGNFTVTAGSGKIRRLDAGQRTLHTLAPGMPGARWDNHLVALPRACE